LIGIDFYPIRLPAAKFRNGTVECATESARAVLDTGADDLYPRLHLILADILVGQGDYRSAAAEYRRVIELAPDSAVAIAVGWLISNWKAQGVLFNGPE
jgi:Tfp pilus assembly protein PilF